jgi:hypothetical protein
VTEASELILFNRENSVGFDVDVLDHAFAVLVIAELHVIDAGLNADDLETLVMIDGVVFVVFCLVLAPLPFPAGDSCSAERLVT